MTFYTGRCKKIYAVEELENLQARRQFYLTAGEISCPINKLFIYTPPPPPPPTLYCTPTLSCDT